MQKFQEIIFDLDAAIPGLEGLMLGRALLVKAQCLKWIYRGSYMNREQNQSSQDTDNESLVSQGLQLALKGKELLISEGADENDLSWADGVVKDVGSKE